MPDFSQPEYASYVELCRSLRLEREWQDCDWLAWDDEQGQNVTFRCGTCDGEFGEPGGKEHWVWLPQLCDWLDMLEAASRHFVEFGRESDKYWAGHHGEFEEGHGPTREEAAARLAIAVGAVKEPADV